MKIAILGTRGIPNHYGGFEQYAELLAVYLVKQGWDVTVYNSSDHPYRETEYKGVHIRHIKDPEKKIGTAGQFLYDLGCILDTRGEPFDLVYQLGYTSSSIFNFLFPRSTLIVTNMDGLEWKRSKYNKAVQRFLRYAEKVAVRRSHYLVADSLGIQTYLKEKFGKDAFYSAYTAEIPENYNAALLQPYDLEPGQYNLVIARLEPENNIETILDAHLPDHIRTPVMVIGNTATQYGRYLTAKYEDEKRIRFLGSIYDKTSLDSIRHFARLYFHGHSVGGTNPSLLEAMACGCNIMAHDNMFNRGVLLEAAVFFSDATGLSRSIADSEAGKDTDFFSEATVQNTTRIRTVFSEEHIFSTIMQQLSLWVRGRSGN